VIKWLLLVTTAIVSSVADIQSAFAEDIRVASKRECAVCHITEIPDFKQDKIRTLIPYDPEPVTSLGRQRVESSERMCFSCHDGFALDSRFLWSGTSHSHPVGIEPDAEVKISAGDKASLTPLNADGKIYCGTCHFAHGIDWEHEAEDEEVTLFLRTSNEESALCISCHAEKTSGPADGNHLVNMPLGSPPKELVDAGARFGKNNTVICQSCHSTHGAPDQTLLVVENTGSDLCGRCHTRRYANSRHEASRFGTHPVNVQSDEVEVSPDLLAAGGKLSPEGGVICQTCHLQHGATPQTSLLVQENVNAALCRSCHESQFSIEKTRHDMNFLDRNLINQREQSVAERGVCSACHLPHGGMGPKMWARDINTLDDPMSGTCQGCHARKGLASHFQVGEMSHPVGVVLKNPKPTMDGLPLYSLEGVKLDAGEAGRVSCPTCHNPHQWNPVNTDDRGSIGSDGDTSNSFLRTVAADPLNRCISCHANKAAVAETAHDFSNGMMNKPKSGVCIGCHLPHNGKGVVMWAGEISDEETSDFCLGCHGEQGHAEKTVTGKNDHPIGIRPKLAAQQLPLFDEYGNRTEDGKIDCATCHDPHRSARFDTAASMTESRNGRNFLRLVEREDSLVLCMACHEEQAVLEGTDHDMRVSASEVTNRYGLGVDESGICSQCHVSHNAFPGESLLAAESNGQHRDVARCRSCHAEGRTAEAKVPPRLDHPPVPISIIEAARREKDLRAPPKHSHLPVYEVELEGEVFAEVTCITCHDPHRWDARSGGSGSEMVSEGDVMSSFLRTSDTRLFYCASCHGPESLYLYKYFHAE
jgi:predicted CXXCH cytochrome family protein